MIKAILHKITNYNGKKEEEYLKIREVINSCRTYEQIDTCWEWSKNWADRYNDKYKKGILFMLIGKKIEEWKK